MSDYMTSAAWEEMNRRELARIAREEAVERADFLYRVEDFLGRVTEWTGSDEDELNDLVGELRHKLDMDEVRGAS